MKPVLNVKGSKLSVINIHYNKNGIPHMLEALNGTSVVTYHNESEYNYAASEGGKYNLIDFGNKLEFEHLTSNNTLKLEILLKESKEYLQVLKDKLFIEMLDNGHVFDTSGIESLKKEYLEQKQYIVGVESALEEIGGNIK